MRSDARVIYIAVAITAAMSAAGSCARSFLTSTQYATRSVGSIVASVDASSSDAHLPRLAEDDAGDNPHVAVHEIIEH